ncbi:MAG: hypothetical protein HDT42_11630 [Ruminococcaceae bacterium]|nr:hypothetical protein [Oscillospiraceae bacterium]
MKKFTALLLTLVMILPLGVNSYANDAEQTQNPEIGSYSDDVEQPQNPEVGSYTDDVEQPQNPYVETYLKALEAEPTAAAEETEWEHNDTIQFLNDYYERDCALAEALDGVADIDLSLITSSIDREDKNASMNELIDVYDSLDAECQRLVYGYFMQYASDFGDARAIEFCEELREEVGARNRGLTAKSQDSISTQSDNFKEHLFSISGTHKFPS